MEPGNYQEAIDHGLQIFSSKDPAQMARRGGGMYRPESSSILLPSLGQLLKVDYPGGDITFKETEIKPLWQWRLLAINYLGRANGIPLSGEFCSFRDLEGGNAFQPAFVNQTISRVSRLADAKNPADLNNACLQLGGELHGRGDAGANINFFPCFPVTVIMWKGDQEISASANILFDQTANHYLHTEDVAVVGDLIADFLCNLCS